MARYLYGFAEGGRDLAGLLGGKGANLAEMTRLGLPVPPGFTVTTEACRAFLTTGSEPDGLAREISEHLGALEQAAQRQLGRPDDPLLVSVRSGARFSMPGSMTDASSIGSHTTAPPPAPQRSDAWLLWHRLARGRDNFGDPGVFDKRVKESRWESFTVTAKDPAFLTALEEFSGRPTGKGGLMTFTDSDWLLTIVANRQPVYRDQPEDAGVWWGYGLFPAAPATPRPSR